MKHWILFLFTTCIAVKANAQTKLKVNGEAIGFNCARIITVNELDTLNYQKIKVYHAEINANCLELSVTCGACDANVELVTDNKLVEDQSFRLNFLLRYDNKSVPCKTEVKTKLYFDLLPYRNMKTGSYILISLLGEKFNLSYK